MPTSSRYPVRYSNGALIVSEPDLTIPPGGFFGHDRFFCNAIETPWFGPNGYNWFVNQMPYVIGDGSGGVAVVFNPNNPTTTARPARTRRDLA